MSDSTAIEALSASSSLLTVHEERIDFIVAALREAGFEIYRPDEHKQALVEKFNETTGDVPACGRCAGHGTIQGIRFNMDDSPVESYREPCPQCMGSGESGFVHCFYGCGFVVRDISPFEAHRRMEDHFEVAHRARLGVRTDGGWTI